ncbi:aspartate aminotransferase, cytoplasmic [Daktulosphaira vitifoliae]|uniref:aspartate aminotransferase, cytoplasmic n=1 Tax=Daktulosphaira vitifoliae TaxID=58002 RepID=UPI0021AA2A7D|nr:aspartate aminotransferase, cytoplasmic [Daktulosphaira vitifoliae]XP_050533698.1 aspartate aminotransferase, cytoplasmic [Daktulosphaira vitifoliae]
MSMYGDVQEAQPIEVFHLVKMFTEDKNQLKVNLSVGAYRTEEGKPYHLPVVKKSEAIVLQNTVNHEYLPILGLESFTKAASSLLLGDISKQLEEGSIFGVQSLSGSGALRIGAEFLVKHLNCTTFYYSSPTWENHHLIFMNSGFKDARKYRYWNTELKSLDTDGFYEDLNNAPAHSVIILHGCAHNPTGIDPTEEQWKKIAEIIKERQLIPFFDNAYQGFASGDVEKDAWSVRYFLKQGFEFLCSQSFAKNFGLYNERAGNLTFVTNSAEIAKAVKSQVTMIVRGMYSNPPNHGARTVSTILNDTELKNEWLLSLKMMTDRIKEMRSLLREKLENLNAPGKWNHITDQIGMFSYTGLKESHVEYLRNKYHIYMLRSGRINVCGLNKNNINYVAEAINESLRI